MRPRKVRGRKKNEKLHAINFGKDKNTGRISQRLLDFESLITARAGRVFSTKHNYSERRTGIIFILLSINQPYSILSKTQVFDVKTP